MGQESASTIGVPRGITPKLQAFRGVWYTRTMRNWMRERMKRRKKKQENESEATGKVGQQKPPVDAHHPEPIVPTYVDSSSEPHEDAGVADPPTHRGRMETEVQPESLATPPPGHPEQS